MYPKLLDVCRTSPDAEIYRTICIAGCGDKLQPALLPAQGMFDYEINSHTDRQLDMPVDWSGIYAYILCGAHYLGQSKLLYPS